MGLGFDGWSGGRLRGPEMGINQGGKARRGFGDKLPRGRGAPAVLNGGGTDQRNCLEDEIGELVFVHGDFSIVE